MMITNEVQEIRQPAVLKTVESLHEECMDIKAAAAEMEKRLQAVLCDPNVEIKEDTGPGEPPAYAVCDLDNRLTLIRGEVQGAKGIIRGILQRLEV